MTSRSQGSGPGSANADRGPMLAPRFRGGPGFVVFWDEPRGGSAAAAGSGDSAGSQNSGSGQGSQPNGSGGQQQGGQQKPQDFSRFVSQGIQEGINRALKKLGLPPSLAEAETELATLRGSGQDRDTDSQPTDEAPVENGHGAQAKPSANVRRSSEYQQLERDRARLERQNKELVARAKQLEQQADEARLEKLRNAALSKNVGPGRQLEAFVALHQHLVRLGPDRQLEVLAIGADGQSVPAGKTVDEWLGEALQGEGKFFLAPDRSQPKGSGSHQEPTGGNSDADAGVEEILVGMGLGKSRSSKLDRLIGGGRGEKK